MDVEVIGMAIRAIPVGTAFQGSDLFVRGEVGDELGIMVVTVGEWIQAWVWELTESGGVTLGMIVDAIGSETVEEIADVVDQIIRNTSRKATTKRYSPGYGDWDVTDQKALLELVESERIGVTVNESSQLVPEKSISAVLGLIGSAQQYGTPPRTALHTDPIKAP